MAGDEAIGVDPGAEDDPDQAAKPPERHQDAAACSIIPRSRLVTTWRTPWAMAGRSPRSDLNSWPSRTKARVSPMAVPVAVRGALSSAAISPMQEPSPDSP